MGSAISSGLVIPALFLALMGWLVPKLLSLRWPEGVRPLMWLAATSLVLMLIIAMATFLVLYLWQGATMEQLFTLGVGNGLLFFLRLGFVSALIWAPIMVLSISGIPRSWVKETW